MSRYSSSADLTLEIKAPTFNSLNKPQKRALLLRDQLRWYDPQHLDSFIEGLTNDEPPTYRRINGTIAPPLTLVTLRKGANRYDLGNVLLSAEDNVTQRAYLMIEDGKVEMRTEAAIPLNEGNLESVAIHGFIAKTMVPMFKEKFQCVLARLNRINETRRVAYNAPLQASVQFRDGETLARLDPVKSEQNENHQYVPKSWKRKPGEPVARHTSNMHKQTGLNIIPANTKSATFDTIPEHVKIDLFDNVVKTAFPNFDNLMMASWNVVSVYSACGSDFPEMHKAIVELKDVLQDFDEAFGVKVSRTLPVYRQEWAGKSQIGVKEIHVWSPAPSDLHGSKVATVQPINDSVSRGKSPCTASDRPEEHSDKAHHDMPPSRDLQLAQDQDCEEEVDEQPQHLTNPHLNVGSDRGSATRETSSLFIPEQLPPSNVANPKRLSSASPSLELQRKRIRKVQDSPANNPFNFSKPVLDTSLELIRRREEYASSIGKTNVYSAGAAKASRPEETSPPPEHAASHSHKASLVASNKKRNLSDFSTAQLRLKYQSTKSNLLQTFGSLNNMPPQNGTLLYTLEKETRIREQPDKARERDTTAEGARRAPGQAGGMFGMYMGNSVLGAKKQAGGAPVAPMMHMRKDGDGRNGSGSNGSVRRSP